MLSNWLYCIIQILRRRLLVSFIADNWVHHQVVGFNQRRVYDCSKLLLGITHLYLVLIESGLSIPLMLLTCLCGVVLALGGCHINCSPCVVLIVIDGLIYTLWISILTPWVHFLLSDSTRCPYGLMCVSLVATNHLIFRVLWRSMLTCIVAVGDCHIHTVLHIVLGSLYILWL